MNRRDEHVTLLQFFRDVPEKRDSVLAFTNERLQHIFAKGGIDLTQSILHHVLHEYVVCAKTSDVRDLIDLFDERLVEMLHTKKGALVGWFVACVSSVKQRKRLVRALKPFVERVATDEYGHIALIRLVCCVFMLFINVVSLLLLY